ncbi:MAG TPA: response regulator [Gemmatimonadaceae bacterium]|jgi:two-component system chemotaxis response regulator CheY|nr:response regulator [Gemmatimonadaceae bacterium]
MHFNVLVVDDSAVMRAMIVRTLRMSGLPLGEVHEAADGEEALARLRASWVDLMLLDINMPIMNGEEVVDRLRADPETADLKIIVVSTERSDARIERLAAKGAAFVQKPFTPEELRDEILRVTGISHEQVAAADDALLGDGLDF